MRFQLVTQGIGSLARYLNGARDRYARKLDRVLALTGERQVAYIKQEFRTGGTTATKTAVRTGRLRNAYGYKHDARGGQGVLDIGAIRATDGGSVPRHARVHEGYDASGARVSQFVIRPKRGKFLAIPLSAAKTGAGVSRGGPRMYSDTFFLPSAKGGTIMQRRGAGAVPLFALRREVIVKPRPSLDAVKARVEKSLPAEVQAAFVEAAGGHTA